MAVPVLDSSSPFTNSPLPLAPRLPRGPVSPVAPRRTAVAAVVRPADLGLPCAALHLSGFSHERRLPAGRDSSPVCAIESQRAPAIPICAQGFGLQMVAAGLSGGLERGSWGTIYLQIAGGPNQSAFELAMRGAASVRFLVWCT